MDTPPPHAVGLATWVLDSSAQLRELRAQLRASVNSHAHTDSPALNEIAEDMVLVATELAGNAMRHGLPPTRVRLLANATEFVVDVADHDLSTMPALSSAETLAIGGRGLQLALALSSQVGWYATDAAKHVWASFPIQS